MRITRLALAPLRHGGLLILTLAVLVGCEANEAAHDAGTRTAQPLDTIASDYASTLSNPNRLPTAPMEQDSTATYTYEIAYPDTTRLAPPLWSAMHDWASTQKAEFVDMVHEMATPADSATLPWGFEVTFDLVLDSDHFTSVRAEGYQYTGGAHGMPIYETFTYDAARDQLLTLETLLADTTALAPISAYAQEHIAATMRQALSGEDLDANMRDWIEEGAAPTLNNYHLFTLTPAENGQPAGVTVIFPPYQVGPYAAGMHEVFVPTSVFEDYLSPAYAGAFATAPPAD